MPEISRFLGMIIAMYYMDHSPPHFHVRYNQYKATISIKDLALLVKKIVGFDGELKFDTSKPNGTPRKLMDVSRLKAAGWNYSTHLEQGIQLAYQDALKSGKLDS